MLEPKRLEFGRRSEEQLRMMLYDLIRVAEMELADLGESHPKFAVAAAPPSDNVAIVPVNGIKEMSPIINQQIKMTEYLAGDGAVSALAISTEAWILIKDEDEMSMSEALKTKVSEHPDRIEVVIVAIFTPYDDSILEARRIERDGNGNFTGLSSENMLPEEASRSYTTFNPWQKSENPEITA